MMPGMYCGDGRKRSAFSSGGFTACLRSTRYTELLCPRLERRGREGRCARIGVGLFFFLSPFSSLSGNDGRRELSETYAEDGQEDVDQQIRAASALEEDAERGEEDGEDDLADVAREARRVSDGLRARALGLTLGAYLAVKAMMLVLFGLLVRVLWWTGLFLFEDFGRWTRVLRRMLW